MYRISVRLSFARPVTFDGSVYGIYGGPRGTGGSGFEGTGVQNTYSGAINYNRVFSPTFLMEARFGVNRYRNDAQQVGYGEKVSDTLGVPGVNQNDFSSGPVGVNLDNFGNPFIGFSPSLPWIRAETNILFTNIWTKTKGNHTIKFGVDIRRIRDDLLQTQTFSPRGLYHFGVAQTSIAGSPTSFGNSFASFLLDVPNDVGRDLPVLYPTYRAWQFFSFVQDKWQVTPKLTLDLGLRWEYYPPATPAAPAGFSQYHPENNTLVLAGLGGNPRDLGLDKHFKDFAPRIGVAYRLNEKTVLRSGFGISYSPWPDNKYAFDNFPVKQNNSYTAPCTLCPAVLPSGQTATFQLGFPAATPAIIPTNGIIDASTTALLNQSYEVVNPHFREPYVESWNFAIQRALPRNFALDVAYVGNHGVDQPANYNLNASTVLNGGVASQPLNQLYGKRSNVTLYFVGHSSNYNGLQIKLDKRFSGGFAMTTAYTYSKSLGYQSEDSGIDFYVNQARNWRRLNFDRTHFFVQSYIYELPFGQNKKYMQSGPGMWILGGWQINGILSFATGQPIDITSPNSTLNTPGNNNTPNWFGPGPIPILHGIGTGQAWFQNTKCSATVTSNCFAQPAAGTFGNLNKNPIDGPGYSNLDLSIFRNFKITERFTLQFRGEGISILNHAQFGNPSGDITSANFGVVTGLANTLPGGNGSGSRQIQLGAKLIF